MRARVAVGSLVFVVGMVSSAAASAKDPPTTTTVPGTTTTAPSAPPVGRLAAASSHGPDGNAASAGGECPRTPEPELPYQLNARFDALPLPFVQQLPPEGGQWRLSTTVPPGVTSIVFTAECNIVRDDGTLVPTMTFGPQHFGFPPPPPPAPPASTPPAPPAPAMPAQPRFTG